MNKRKQTIREHQKQIISELKNENFGLKERVVVLEKENDLFKEKLEKALLYIEELQKYVFRGKKKNEDSDKDSHKPKSGNSQKRSKKSYRRSIPDKSEITDTEVYDLKNCPDCGNKLLKLKILEFYEQDILPMQEWFKKLKKTTLIKITTGYCKHCQKRFSAIPIPKQKVFIGENIKQLVVFQSTVQQLSHSQILDFLESHLNFQISTGEIVSILSQQALKLKPAFDDLLKNIREGPGAHLDETSYKIAFPDEYSGDYAWVMASMENSDTVFMLGRNRGKGNVKKLLGDGYQGIGVTDDYGAYLNSFKKGNHALCWAHPHRKFRDLKNSDGLSEEKKKECQEFYKQFAELYGKVRKVNQTNFKKKERIKISKALRFKLETILKPNQNDPAKLKTLKKTMLRKIDRYFICLLKPNIPTDNNKAERSLRHLVIKRRKSFGSKTPKGAKVMSILYSVVMSLWWRSKKDFFREYAGAVEGQ